MSDEITITLSKEEATKLFRYLKTWDKKTYAWIDYSSFFGRQEYNQFFSNLEQQVKS